LTFDFGRIVLVLVLDRSLQQFEDDDEDEDDWLRG
jgi:hypothetical protein